MQLGSFQFGLATAAYQEFTRSTAYTWAAQSRFGKDDALQSTGPGSDEITLPGVIYPEFRGGAGQLDDMRALAAKAEPLTLIDGRGNMLGEWVIESVEEHGSIFAQSGVARKQEFSLKMRRFPDDSPIASPIASSIEAGLVASITGGLPTKSIINAASEVTMTATNSSASLMGNLSGSLSSVTGYASQIGSQAPGILSAINSGINAASRLRKAAVASSPKN